MLPFLVRFLLDLLAFMYVGRYVIYLRFACPGFRWFSYYALRDAADFLFLVRVCSISIPILRAVDCELTAVKNSEAIEALYLPLDSKSPPFATQELFALFTEGAVSMPHALAITLNLR